VVSFRPQGSEVFFRYAGLSERLTAWIETRADTDRATYGTSFYLL